MSYLIEYPLEDGSSILIEAEESAMDRAVLPAARPGEVAVRAGETFEQAVARITPAASAVIAHMRSLADTPDTVSIEFGLKMTASAGAVVAAASVEANYCVTLTWNRHESDRGGGT